MSYHLNDFNYCKDCGFDNEEFQGLQCIKCGQCVTRDEHCHVNDICTKLIEDCHEHYEKCDDQSHHDECACQDGKLP